MTTTKTLWSKSGSRPIKHIIAAVVSFLMFVVAPGAETRRKYDPPTFALGQQKIGEKLRYFKSLFPGSACGTPTDPTINRHTLDDPDDSGFLTCCIDDPESLKKFSELRILMLFGQCPVVLGFWKERLYSLDYEVEASTIEQILPEFEKIYGPAHRKLWGRDHQLALVSWWYGDEIMELSKGESERDTGINDSQSKNRQKMQCVNIRMQALDFGR